MSFFNSLASMIINFIKGVWAFMVAVAGKAINSTFGWYTGTPIDDTTCAYFIYGGLLAILVVYIFFRKSLQFRQ